MRNIVRISVGAYPGLTVDYNLVQILVLKSNNMPKYVIEREIPSAGRFSQEDLKGIAQKSCSILHDLGTGIHWIHSYVTDDKIYCVYHSANEELISQHAERGGFPANAISEIRSIIDPATSE